MATTSGHAPVESARDRTPAPWRTIGLVAVLTAYADGFWLVSLEGAIGIVEPTHEPFDSWLRASTAMLPGYVLVVLAAVRFARHRFGGATRGPRAVLVTGLILATACTALGTVAIAVNTAQAYQVQSQQLSAIDVGDPAVSSSHHHDQRAREPRCDPGCQARRATLALSTRAVTYAAGVLAVTNSLLVGWVVAIRGGRLLS